ncbi:MAG TPA: hypothetical protein VHX38_31080 [Pseudonocardiaceae bacterium]|jgi:hypothetical protein|nr:hypothetical protein [Pseudonocardiaceae bacterium]
MSTVDISLAASYSCAEAAGADLRTVAREFTPRKVMRFLDGASLAPFVAAAIVYRRNPCCDPARVALYTVSGWDGAQPDPPFTPDGSAADDIRLGRHILEDANPTGWLRMLGNNALCQVSILEGFRGPNAHLVGDAHALWQALVTAGADLASGAADLAIVLAYDPPEEERGNPSDRTTSSATAVALTADGGPDVLATLLADTETAARSGCGALAALETALAAVGKTTPETAPEPVGDNGGTELGAAPADLGRA